MAVDMFLKINGIKGESTDSNHAGDIEVLSYNWGVHQPTGDSTSAGGAHAVGRASFSEFSVVKRVDLASPKLMQSCANGTATDVVFTLNRAGGAKTPFLEYKLSKAIVTSYRPAANSSSSDLPMEEVGFKYSKIEMTYTQTDKNGQKVGNVASKWNLETNKSE